MEIDADVDGADGIGHFQKTILQTFRTSIGELAMPTYHGIIKANKMNPSMFYNINVYLIWGMYCVQTFFMLVIMLNFLIAVITNTYDRVSNYQKVISFKNKADLNEECYMLINIFKKLKEYKIIVFSTSKEAIKLENNDLDDSIGIFKRNLSKNTREVLEGHDKLRANVMTVKD